MNSFAYRKGEIKIFLFLFVFVCSLQLTMRNLFAEENKLTTLSKQIIEAKPETELYPVFEELKGLYFKDNRYPEFLDFLKSLGRKKKNLQPLINYYTALSRFYQLKYLEDIQDWNEYFSEGDQYRAELEKGLLAAIKDSTPNSAVYLSAQLLFYRFHKEKQDGLAQEALKNLLNSATEYSKQASDSNLLKDVADQLLTYGEKTESRKIYYLYVEKLAGSSMKSEQLGNIALEFYNKGNLELAQVVYDAYIKQIENSLTKEEFIPLLINIAKNFTYKDEGQSDPAYAEKIFQEVERKGAENVFNQDLIYLRAFNLEKMLCFKEARDVYLILLKQNQASKYADEAEFKIAVFDTYMLGNPEEGKKYFEGLAKKEKVSPQVISGLYQLGLLGQWKEDLTNALNYYNKLIALAKSDFPDISSLTQERIEEINNKTPLEYNLKTFLDAALKTETSVDQTEKVNLQCKPYKTKKDSEVNVNSNTTVPESGCTQVELRYLWSGDLGISVPSGSQASFSTKYQSPGTKLVNVVVVNPSGITDYGLDLVDVE